MREIKFRAWNSKYSSTVYDVFPTREKLDSDYLYYMQYTGLKDKNDVEIYEGDIVTIDDPENLYVVEFQDGAFIPVSEILEDCDESYNLQFYEVIGNIYENLELLDNYESSNS